MKTADVRYIDQGFRSRDRRARVDRQEARGRRPAARTIARAVRTRRAAVALLPLPARGGRAAHRDPHRRGELKPRARLADRRRGARLTRWSRRREPLSAFLERYASRVDEALDRFLPRPPSCPSIVAEAMRYSVFAGGKRLRPVLTLAAADAVARGRRRRPGWRCPPACAIELIHTYSLIHDDLPAMDNDTLRRGRPTLHVVYGDGIAILAGDGLQAEAFALLAREPAPTATLGDRGAQAARPPDRRRRRGTGGHGRRAGHRSAGRRTGARAPDHARCRRRCAACTRSKTGALIRASAVSGA